MNTNRVSPKIVQSAVRGIDPGILEASTESEHLDDTSPPTRANGLTSLPKHSDSVAENIISFEDHPARYIHRSAVRTLNIGTLVEQFLVHMLYPFSVPYLDKVYGPQAKAVQILDLCLKGETADLFR